VINVFRGNRAREKGTGNSFRGNRAREKVQGTVLVKVARNNFFL
jgi:hypothetical protein